MAEDTSLSAERTQTYDNIITFGLALIVIVANAYARLGEGEADIEARFGKGEPAKTSDGADKVVRYKVGVYVVHIAYSQGKSVSESYAKPSPFSDLEIEVFLERNHGGGTT